MYICGVCNNVSEPGEPMRRYITYRTNRHGHQEIAHETPLCNECNKLLAVVPFSILLRQRGKAIRLHGSMRSGQGTKPIGKVLDTFPGERTIKVNLADLRTPCDLCGQPVGNGQKTAESVLCVNCIRKAQKGAC